MAHLIATHIITKRLEFAPFTAPLRLAAGRHKRARAQRSQLGFTRAAHVGIDLYRGGLAHACLTPYQPPMRQITHCDQSEFETTAFWRSQTVDHGRGGLRLDVYTRFA